jgi:hypothetical protein
MKQSKIKLDKSKGLNLDKEAITKLQESQIDGVKGGLAEVGSCADVSCTKSCAEQSCNTHAALDA